MSDRIPKIKKSKRKFAVIAKVANNHFVKYRTNKPENFVLFLVKKYPGALWCNFYSTQSRQIVGTWGNKKGLLMTASA